MLHATARAALLVFSILFFVSNPAGAQSNTMGAATAISPVTSCGATTGQTIYNATSDGPTSTCAGTTNDVWYTFTTPANVTSIQIAVTVGGGSNLNNTNAFIEAFNARTMAAVTSSNTLGCDDINAGLSLTGLTASTLYYLRIFTSAVPTSTPSNKWTFSICASYTTPVLPPANDECSGAVTLTIGTTNNSGTVWAATASSSIPSGCAYGTPDDDVWYKFTATSTSVTATLSGLGSNLSAAGAYLQLFSGSCASLSSMACGYTTLSASGLTVGNTYYLRVYSYTFGSIGGVSSGSAFSITVSIPTAVTTLSNIGGSRMNEVFLQTTLAPANTFDNPWEVLYGPDKFLWITESRGYKVYRMNPATGLKSTILDISQNSPFLPAAEQSFNLQFNFSGQGSPQGGLAGMALHPNFLNATTPKNYVYLSYIHTYVSTAASDGGVFFTNRIVRFTFNTITGLLESPVSLCDTLPGSSDHNSQRMIIAPVGGTNYLFYAAGDMGAGQFSNLNRTSKCQNITAYEGKILRFNLEDDGDGGTLDKWIPNDNPFNSTSQNAVWSTGMRNNQGFAYAAINGTDYIYGSSHGPFSDDEINIIERGKNYGHPLVIGYSADGNYNDAKAGLSTGSLPFITSESANAATIGSTYKDPIFTFYSPAKGTTSTTGTVQYIYNQFNSGNGANAGWPSEAPSGLDIYTNSFIPGWKNSLVSAALKWGRLLRLKLNTAGNSISATEGQDTVSYFDSENRFRDIAFAPDGKDIFVIMDKSTASSGPSTNNPAIIACGGCVQKYTFLGYAHNSATNRSTIPASIDISTTTANTVTAGTATTIDATNNTLWVPITGPDGNIIAEIKANGNNLGTITSSFYNHSGTVREDAAKRLYLNRSITITPQNQPTSTVNVRFYITSSELTSLIGATNSVGAGSNVSSISSIKVLKNTDASPAALTGSTATIIPSYAVTHAGNTTGGYVLQADISSFSSFYFGDPTMTVLPIELISFKGELKDNATVLEWETDNEQNSSHFNIERSTDSRSFEKIGTVSASGNSSTAIKYTYSDYEVKKQASDIVYYRLKMVDKDGHIVTSNIINVSIDAQTSLVLYPNPINNVLNMQMSMTRPDNVQIQITDMQGRIIYTSIKSVRQGVTNISIDTKAWARQTYLVQVKGSDNKVLTATKVVKAK